MMRRTGRLQVLFCVVLTALVGVGCSANSSTPVAAGGKPGPLVSAPPPIAAATGLSDVELAKRFGAAVWRVGALGCGFLRSGSALALDAHPPGANNHVG